MKETLTTDLRFSIIPEWVLYSDVSDRALRVYAILARYADSDTLQAFPSRSTIAEKAKCGVKSVDRAVDELVKIGAIEKKHRIKDGVYQSSLFTVIRVGVASRVTLGGVSPDPRVASPLTNRTITNELEPLNDINRFNEFWNVYPKKVDKRVALRAFQKALKRTDYDTIIAGATFYRDDANRKPEFTKNPATWLNADAWENGSIVAPAPVNEWGKPFVTGSKSPYVGGPREWVKDMHDLGEHFECRPGEFGCK